MYETSVTPFLQEVFALSGYGSKNEESKIKRARSGVAGLCKIS